MAFKNFWTENPELSSLIHDTNGSFASGEYFVKKEIEKIASIPPPRSKEQLRTLENLRFVEKAFDKIKETIDFFYSRMKEKYESTTK